MVLAPAVVVVRSDRYYTTMDVTLTNTSCEQRTQPTSSTGAFRPERLLVTLATNYGLRFSVTLSVERQNDTRPGYCSVFIQRSGAMLIFNSTWSVGLRFHGAPISTRPSLFVDARRAGGDDDCVRQSRRSLAGSID